MPVPSLYSPPPEPPILLHEDQPQVNDIITEIPPWIFYHFRQTFNSDVHYENQLYGCVNTFLTSIFPVRRHYMIIPQVILRRVMAQGEFDDDSSDLSDVSISSSGGYHESRHLAGREVNKMVPDFLVVKVTPQAGCPRNHCIVCLIEVKRKTDTHVEARRQMREYMQRAAEQPRRTPDMYGYLVMNDSFDIYRICNQDNSVSNKGNFTMFGDNGDTFTRGLADISSQNWNR